MLIIFQEECLPELLITIVVSIASWERWFSELKLNMSHLRASMCQERLGGLSLLSIERAETEDTDFDALIGDFAAARARKV